MTVLGLDTSSATKASIGIAAPGGFFYETLVVNHRGQETGLMTAVETSLQRCGFSIGSVDCFACGTGPGSFTGLRIGLSTARALAWSLGKRIVGFSSLALLAASAPEHSGDTLVVPLIDARMNKVFAAAFVQGKRVMPDSDIRPEDLIAYLQARPETGIVFAGDGLKRYGEIFRGIEGKTLKFYPDACVSGLATCRFALKALNGEMSREEYVEGIEKVMPEYLRKSEAENQLESGNK